MCPEPASVIPPLASLGPCRVIGLFLARLLAYLIRLETACERHVPADIAHMVASADTLVHGFIRMRAAAQLEHAGFHDTAHAMRTPPGMRRETAAPIDMPPAPPADLITRLKASIENFERAEALASLLARIIVCALAYMSSETRSPFVRARAIAHPVSMSFGQTRPAPPPWPPPIAGGSPFGWGTTLSADPRPDLGSMPQDQQHALKYQQRRGHPLANNRRGHPDLIRA